MRAMSFSTRGSIRLRRKTARRLRFQWRGCSSWTTPAESKSGAITLISPPSPGRSLKLLLEPRFLSLGELANGGKPQRDQKRNADIVTKRRRSRSAWERQANPPHRSVLPLPVELQTSGRPRHVLRMPGRWGPPSQAFPPRPKRAGWERNVAPATHHLSLGVWGNG